MVGKMPTVKPLKASRSAVVRCIVHSYHNVDGAREFEIFYQEHVNLDFIVGAKHDWVTEELASEIDVILDDIFHEHLREIDEFYAEVVSPMFVRYYTKETIEGTERRFECWHKNAKVKRITEAEAEQYLTKEYSG